MMSLNWTTTKVMLCCVIWKNSQFTLTTIQVTGRAFAKQLHHELTCLMWVNIKLNDEALLPGQAKARCREQGATDTFASQAYSITLTVPSGSYWG